MGPRSRAVLSGLTDADLSNQAFPFGHAATITIAAAPVRVLRVTYVGELGYELHVPIAAAAELFDAIMAAGAAHGLKLAGYRSLESLRLEKFYRAWGSDITANDTPFEAGLGAFVKLGGVCPSSAARLWRRAPASRCASGSAASPPRTPKSFSAAARPSSGMANLPVI